MNSNKTVCLLAAVCTLCLLVGMAGVTVGTNSYYELVKLEKSIDKLESENEQLRAAITKENSFVRPPELTFVVKNPDRPKKKESLAIRNRNYLNIKRLPDGSKWEGELGVDRYGHVIFSDAAYSVRAGALTLVAYERRHGVKTISQLVSRFSESNQTEYVNFLCKRLKVSKDQQISLTQKLPELLKAMIAFECGVVVGDEYVDLVAAIR